MTHDPAPPSWRRPTIALLAGALVALSMPPWGWWPLAFIGILVFEAAMGDEPSRRRRALLGFAFGAGWMYPAMAWMWFLTVPGYVVACALFAGYHAAAAAIAPTGPWRVVGRPAAHTVAEMVRFVFPFGGVPLASIGISQAGGPLLDVARVGGVLLLTWLVFQVGVALAQPATALVAAIRHRSTARTLLPFGAPALAVAVVTVIAAAIAPDGSDRAVAPMRIAAVQGGGEQGTRALDVPSSLVTARHLEATRSIEPDPSLDLVVWPENGIDVNGRDFLGSEQYDQVVAEAERLGVPIAVGVTLDSEFSLDPVDDSFVNAQVLVVPSGQIRGWYEKVQIVPFGEYVPFRGLLEALGAPLENVASDATRGSEPAYLVVDHAHEPGLGVGVGVMISWEVFFADRGRAAGDGMLLINPTNGASYTWTILQTQQIASSKLRAAETGRWVVQVSPTGFSAFVSPDGGVFRRTDVGEQAVIVADVPLREGSTWYQRTGDWPWRIAVVAVLALGWIASLRRRGEPARDPETDLAEAASA